MTLTQPPGGNVAYGVYLSPYMAKINSSSTAVPVICDDFTDDTWIGETWTAQVFAGGGDLSGTRMAASLPSGQTLVQSYDAIASLALQLLALGHSPNINTQAILSFAIWDIFADKAVSDWLNGHGGGGTFLSDVKATASTALSHALTSPGQRSVLTIYSPAQDPQATCDGRGCPTPIPQEFITVKTPEASAAAILVVDLLGLASAIVLSRRRPFRAPR
ncbi:MAG: hypothetical protein JST11_30830 [Acidobacteria bacterium]|nr:hypothetical protein [Acidobacteriota bacterium]